MKGLAILHCIHISHNGLVYVCERGSDRVQVFTKQGRFVTEFFVHPSTPARGPECGGPGSLRFGHCGTVLNLAFSPARDGQNPKVTFHPAKIWGCCRRVPFRISKRFPFYPW